MADYQIYTVFTLIARKNSLNELKEGRQSLLRETLALFGQAQHPENQTLALLGLLQAATRAK
jgi:hypothetical protein